VIGKETDLAPEDRWPDYRSLPAPVDRDADGIPDAWETQRGLNPTDPRDATAIVGGYSNIEHYLNNTQRPGETRPVVFVRATVSRAKPGQAGVIRVVRIGERRAALAVRVSFGGSAEAGRDYPSRASSVVIPAGADSTTLEFPVLATTRADRMASVSLLPGDGYVTGCPEAALIVTRLAPPGALSNSTQP
jgi:hypothetical protein